MSWLLLESETDIDLSKFMDVNALDKRIGDIVSDVASEYSDADAIDDGLLDSIVSTCIERCESGLKSQLTQRWSYARQCWYRQYKPVIRGGKKVGYDELVAEINEPGTNPKIKDSDLSKFKDWFTEFALDEKKSMGLSAVKGIAKKQISDRINDMKFPVEELKDRVLDSDDKFSTTLEIMSSLPDDFDRDKRWELRDSLIDVIVQDLLKHNSLEELADEYFVDYGYQNGWSDKTSLRYSIATTLHDLHKEKHPEQHEKSGYDTVRGDHSDGCKCGLTCKWDSSD